MSEHPTSFAGLMTGRKDDGEKPRMDLLDPEFLEEVARVLTFGAHKYAAHNWRGGISYSRLIAAIYRHLGAINRGEDIDPESGRPHTGHLGCCIQFLDWMMKNRKDLDDRWKNGSKHVPEANREVRSVSDGPGTPFGFPHVGHSGRIWGSGGQGEEVSPGGHTIVPNQGAVDRGDWGRVVVPQQAQLFPRDHIGGTGND